MLLAWLPLPACLTACPTACPALPLSPTSRNCPECKQRPDVMQLSADANASYEYCQRVHACAICACK
jgi:hypothetical protein